QNTIAPSVVENPTITVGTMSAKIAAMITRWRPSTSAITPVQGAISAIAKGGMLTVKLTATGVAWSCSASIGNSDCVAQRSRNEARPQRITAADYRGSGKLSDGGFASLIPRHARDEVLGYALAQPRARDEPLFL